MAKLPLTHAPGNPPPLNGAGPGGLGSGVQMGVPMGVQSGTGGIVAGGTIDLSRVFPEVGGSINSVRQEIDDAFADMKTFYQREPDEVMRLVSGHSSRMSELKVRILRWEDVHRMWRPIRVREVEPCIEELREQYVIASRLQSTRELDWKMSGGQP